MSKIDKTLVFGSVFIIFWVAVLIIALVPCVGNHRALMFDTWVYLVAVIGMFFTLLLGLWSFEKQVDKFLFEERKRERKLKLKESTTQEKR